MHTLARPRAQTHSLNANPSRVSRESTPARPEDGAQRGSPPRGGSWALPAPEGVYGPLRAWPSASVWFDAVLDILRTPEGEEARRRAKVAPDTLLRVAHADRTAADQSTGRGVATAHDTVADALGMSGKTVQRARQLLEALGLAVTVAEGRYLTTTEREQAHAKHGGQQLRAASTRALTLPREYTPPTGSAVAGADSAAVENVQLPTRRGVKNFSPINKRSPKRAHPRAQEDAAARRPATTKTQQKSASQGPRPIDIQRLAAGLCARMSWLERATSHVGKLCDVLAAHGLAGRGWTAESLLDAIQRGRLERRIPLVDVTSQRDSFGYFVWLLRATIDPGSPAPFLQLQIESRLRAERQALKIAHEAARRAEIRAEADEISAVISRMREHFPSRPRPSRKHFTPPRSAR
jgi:hypothetical protein